MHLLRAHARGFAPHTARARWPGIKPSSPRRRRSAGDLDRLENAMPRTEERDPSLHPAEFGHDALAHDTESADGHITSSRLDRARFQALEPQPPLRSRIAQWNHEVRQATREDHSPPTWVSRPEPSRSVDMTPPLPGSPTPLVSAPPGRRPIGATSSRHRPAPFDHHRPTANDDAHDARWRPDDGDFRMDGRWMPMPSRPVSPMSSLHERAVPLERHASASDDGRVPLLSDDDGFRTEPRHTPFPSRPVTPSTTFDPSDRDSHAGTSAFTDRATYDASNNWQDPSFQNDFTPGMQRPGQPRRPGMNGPDDRWTSRLRPWENVIEGGASVMAMMARTIINVVQSIAQIFEKWGDALVSLTRR
ncbi:MULTISPECIES: hypothetical protein [Burkholderia cepacia complex]|nr:MULTISPECIES: hypothetical protein [Burkholderia cepacia complex]MBR8157559.1 hypothetical protein [Burkholderia cenocepacia]MBR8415436.1 hypothetical protein [Burkholderia cenocepacia]HEB3534328.1 hypothetical protein [Burkholderia cenocepacia]